MFSLHVPHVIAGQSKETVPACIVFPIELGKVVPGLGTNSGPAADAEAEPNAAKAKVAMSAATVVLLLNLMIGSLYRSVYRSAPGAVLARGDTDAV